MHNYTELMLPVCSLASNCLIPTPAEIVIAVMWTSDATWAASVYTIACIRCEDISASISEHECGGACVSAWACKSGVRGKDLGS